MSPTATETLPKTLGWNYNGCYPGKVRQFIQASHWSVYFPFFFFHHLDAAHFLLACLNSSPFVQPHLSKTTGAYELTLCTHRTLRIWMANVNMSRPVQDSRGNNLEEWLWEREGDTNLLNGGIRHFVKLRSINKKDYICVCHQDEVVVKVDSTKEVLKKRRWVLAAASEKSTAARAGMTGKKLQHSLPEDEMNHALLCSIAKWRHISSLLREAVIQCNELNNPLCYLCLFLLSLDGLSYFCRHLFLSA